METAVLRNAFIGKPDKPTDKELAAELGEAKPLWDKLVADLAHEFALTQEWNSSSRKLGWSLRLKKKERNIVYLAPCRGGFTASFALGEKAIEALRKSRLPKAALKIINEAKR